MADYKTLDIDSIVGKEGINYDELNFKPAKIEIVELRDYSTPEEERLRIIIQTNIVKKGTKLRGTEFINCFRDENGNIAYSTSPNSNATKILNFFGVKNFKELIGKDCKLIVRMNKPEVKKLGIYYG